MREHSPFRQKNKRKGQEKRQEMGVGKGHRGNGNPWRKHYLLGGGNGGGLGVPTSSQSPRELGHQGPTFKPQEATWAASQSWASRVSSAKGCGTPTGIPVMAASLLPPWGHSAARATSPAPCRAVPTSPFSASPDQVTAYPPGFRAVCSAPRSPLGLDTGSRRNATRQVCANTGTAWSPSVFSLVSKISI